MRFLTLLLATIILFSNCSAGTIDPNVADSKYIEYGEQHECVVQISGEYPDQSVEGKKVGFIASCVIIRPRVVLTAAHVIDGAENIHIILNDEKIKVLCAIRLKAYDKNVMSAFDIAICYLEKEAKIDFYPELYSKDDEVGKTCSIAGFGMTGNHRTGAKVHDEKKRAGSNHIDELFCGMLVCSLNTKPHTALEFLIAHGDSGGGLFIDQKLAGINSTIMTHKGGILNSDLQDQSCHTRISLHKPWIDFVVQELEESENIKNTKISTDLFDFL